MGHGHNHEIELTGKNPSSGGSNYANIYHDIVQPFSNKSFPKFEKKPKVFIFESCQNFAISDYSACLKMQNDIPSDILICLPALPGFSAYRNKTQGSLFMHYLVKIMMNHAHNMHMVELMGKVMQFTNKFGFNYFMKSCNFSDSKTYSRRDIEIKVASGFNLTLGVFSIFQILFATTEK